LTEEKKKKGSAFLFDVGGRTKKEEGGKGEKNAFLWPLFPFWKNRIAERKKKNENETLNEEEERKSRSLSHISCATSGGEKGGGDSPSRICVVNVT